MDISMLLQDATENIIDWTDDDGDNEYDDDDDKVCCYDNKDTSSSPVPLILVTDHVDEFTDAKSQESKEQFKWHVNHRRGSLEAKLLKGWRSFPSKSNGRLFYSNKTSTKEEQSEISDKAKQVTFLETY
eukprot:Seg2936.4 transcript_id=Seg2936.4/GoldUCD/mRNA.D3Y31 product="hypothetical protein" protein_id=Seg2936.4/GoldUCD/D3Y31